MASSLLSTRASLSSSFSLPPSQVSISSSSSSFVSIAYFRHQPLSLESKPESAVLPLVECSSRPQKKCTAHHNKTRPKKHNPYDKNRKPTVYPKLPKAPPIYTLGWPDDVEVSAPAAPVEPVTVGA